MLKTKSQIPHHSAKSQESTPEEAQKAQALQLSVTVYRLQEQLRKLPLVPRQDWLRKKRMELLERLYLAARRDHCLKHINPWAASDSALPIARHNK
jgi:hypothetical protein